MLNYRRPPLKFILWDLLVALILGLLTHYLGLALYLAPDFLPILNPVFVNLLAGYAQFQLLFMVGINYYFLTHFRGRRRARK